MRNRIKAIVFDFGGVIAEEGFRNGLHHMAALNGRDPDVFFRTAEDIIHRPPAYVTGASGEAAYWNAVREATGIASPDAKLREIILSRFVIRPRMLELADQLRARGFITAILSDQTNWLDEINAADPFFSQYNLVLNSYHLGKSKRDPSVFDDLCDRLGLEPADIIFVDDNPGNIERAANRGLGTILFTTTEAFECALAPCLSEPLLTEQVFDCIIVGAGPGGLQAAIYLGRYNRTVLLIDRGGGRTTSARHIENFFSQKAVSGKELIRLGTQQARHFNVTVIKGAVTGIEKRGAFAVHVGETLYRSRFVIVSTGGRENLPEIGNLQRFFGDGLYTCVDCDGYHTTGKRLVLIGNSIYTIRLAIGMKQMYTSDITLVLMMFEPPEEYVELLRDENIALLRGRPRIIIGTDRIEALELQDGSRIPCDVIMTNFGFKLNKEFLAGLDLKLDTQGFKIVTDHNYESSLKGLYVLGPLTGHDQVAIAAGEGALAAIHINSRLLDL